MCLGIALCIWYQPPSLGTRGLVDTQCICPFRPKGSVGRKGQIPCVSARPLVHQVQKLATGKYGCRKVQVYPAECAEQLGRDPSKNGSSKSLVLEIFSGEGTRKAFQPEFGAYRGLARVLKSPSNPQAAEKRRKSWKRALLFSAPNSGMHQTLVQKRSEEHFGTRPFQSPSPSGIRLYFVRPHFPSPEKNSTQEFGSEIRASKTLKTRTSLNKEVRPFFLSDKGIWSFPSVFPLAITAFGGPEGYFSLAITAIGAFSVPCPKY